MTELMTEMYIPTPAQLKRLLVFWQKVLRLQDWHITISYAKGGELSNPNAVAENGYDLGHKKAMIKIIHPKDSVFPDPDVENSLVHELLHLHITPAVVRGCPGDAFVGGQATDAEESAIALITEALVKLKRAIR